MLSLKQCPPQNSIWATSRFWTISTCWFQRCTRNVPRWSRLQRGCSRAKLDFVKKAKSKGASYRGQASIVVHDDIAWSSASSPVKAAVFHSRKDWKHYSEVQASRIAFKFLAKEYLRVHNKCYKSRITHVSKKIVCSLSNSAVRPSVGIRNHNSLIQGHKFLAIFRTDVQGLCPIIQPIMCRISLFVIKYKGLGSATSLHTTLRLVTLPDFSD